MKLILVSVILFSFVHSSFSQTCSTCFFPPKVVIEDLDIQVGKQPSGGDDANFQALSAMGAMNRNFLEETNRTCVRFVDPLSIINTKSPDGSSAVLCQKSDYLITRTIKASGAAYVLHLEVKTSCSGQTLASSDQTFQSLEDTAYLRTVAENAALALGPLGEKINRYTLDLRKTDREFALGNTGGSAITIEPKKNDLSPNEETDVVVTLKDCDGAPLAGRKINFMTETVEGVPIEGTTGGTVTPSQVITDGFGRATVKFKMGKDKSAMIRPHSVYKKPSGGKGVMKTGVKLPRVLAYVSVDILYFKDEKTTTDVSAFMPLLKGQPKVTTVSQDYYISFDHISQDARTGFLVIAVPEEGQDRTVYYDTLGNYSYVDDDPTVTLDTRGGAIEIIKEMSKHYVDKDKREVNPRRQASVVFFKGNDVEPMRFDLGLNWETDAEVAEGTSVRGAASLSINPNTIGAKFKVFKSKSTTYKTEYTIEYLNKDLGSMDDYNKATGKNLQRLSGAIYYTGTEALLVRIRSTY
jgi:hypothetical protein